MRGHGCALAIGFAAFLLWCFFMARATGEEHRQQRVSLRTIFDAIRAVESGGNPYPPDGDNGASVGPYQIGRDYWQDAADASPHIARGSWADCRRADYAEAVMLAYWSRWCPRAVVQLDAQTLARVHNGGPRGAEKSATLAYWNRVRAALE